MFPYSFQAAVTAVHIEMKMKVRIRRRALLIRLPAHRRSSDLLWCTEVEREIERFLQVETLQVETFD